MNSSASAGVVETRLPPPRIANKAANERACFRMNSKSDINTPSAPPGSADLDCTMTTRPASGTGQVRSTVALNRVKKLVFSTVASSNVAPVVIVNTGWARR